MFGLVHAGLIHLKADEHNAAAFDRERLAPFSYKTEDGEHQTHVLSPHSRPAL
jgi:TfoX/Sxy family transcriptional regulator of competence genes